ncbi:MAG TPA: MipA/OmpV family protein, partial [Burkholderiales bacterium]|nr:MipA/OmpV family protein [Burkholderiales bacterium]
MSISRPAGVLLALMAMAPWGARGGEFPLWEAGAGVAVIDFPDYRGSNERRVIALPIPYLVYRGDLLKA